MKQALSKKNTRHEEKVTEEGVSPPEGALASRLKWIVSLLQNETLDLEGPPQALRALVSEMRAYLRGIRIQCAGVGHGGPHLTVLGKPSVPDELPMRGQDDEKPLNDKLALIQAALQRVLKEFLHPGSLALPVVAEVTVRYSLHHAADQHPLQRNWFTDDVREGLRFRLLEDLVQAHGLLRECARAGCGKIFVRQYRQEFCTAVCRNRANVRKYYERTKADKGGVTGKPSGATEPPARKPPAGTKKTTRRATMK